MAVTGEMKCALSCVNTGVLYKQKPWNGEILMNGKIDELGNKVSNLWIFSPAKILRYAVVQLTTNNAFVNNLKLSYHCCCTAVLESWKLIHTNRHPGNFTIFLSLLIGCRVIPCNDLTLSVKRVRIRALPRPSLLANPRLGRSRDKVTVFGRRYGIVERGFHCTSELFYSYYRSILYPTFSHQLNELLDFR